MRDHIAPETPDERVAALLSAAAAPAERPVPGEAEALAAFRREMASPIGPLRRRMQSRTTVKLTAVTALSAVSILGGGLAAASTGALPGAAQQTARNALARVGVSVPGPADQAAEASATRGKSAEAKATATPTAATTTTESTAAAAEEAEESKGKGEAVSELATSTELTGVEKGAAVSGLASGGKSQAGQHGKPTPTPTTTATESTETSTDEDDTATDGREKADEASGGRSGDRSGTTGTTAP